MKKIFFLILAFLTLAMTSAWACFNSDPSSILNNTPVVIAGTDGSMIEIEMPGWDFEFEIKFPTLQIAASAMISFPYTLNMAFSGFINDDGSEDRNIKRLILFYYSTNNEWTVLRDIKNPSFSVVNDSRKAIFGRHCIPGTLGFSGQNNAILLVLYFETDNHESFDLANFLANKKLLEAPTIVDVPVIALGVGPQVNRVAH